MPSPFPGMDPFIESQKWEDFHTRFISSMSDALVQQVRPKYAVDVERRIYLETNDSVPVQSLVVDAAVLKPIEESPRPLLVDPGNIAVLQEAEIEPRVCTIPYDEEHRETYITIRRGKPSEIVTVIELLSPTNKRPNTNGRKIYSEKSAALLKTRAHFVELDLLRNGERTLVSNPPPGDYFAMVSRAQMRPNVEVYGWPMLHRLPTIPIPLADGDPDAKLDLQSVFVSLYDRAGYDYTLDYHQNIEPSLNAEVLSKIKFP